MEIVIILLLLCYNYWACYKTVVLIINKMCHIFVQIVAIYVNVYCVYIWQIALRLFLSESLEEGSFLCLLFTKGTTTISL